MKKLLNYLSLLSVLGILLYACTREEPVMDWKYVHETKYLVQEAKEFFENLIIDADENGTLDLKSGLALGEITPQWDNAYLYSDSKYDYVLIDFIADFYYNVRETVIKDGETVYRTFPAYQHLLIRKNKTTGDMGAAYTTLIPNRLYHIKHRKNVPDNFFKKENRGNYKGLLFFYDVVTMQLLTAEKYDNGTRISGVYYHQCSSFEDFASQVQEYLVNYAFLRYTDILTRSDGESGSSGSENNNNNNNNNDNNNGGDNGGDLPPPGYESGLGTEENPIPVPPAIVTPGGGEGWNGSEDPFAGNEPDEDTGGLPIGGTGNSGKTKFYPSGFYDNGYGSPLQDYKIAKLTVDINANSYFMTQNAGGNYCVPLTIFALDNLLGGEKTFKEIVDIIERNIGKDLDYNQGLSSQQTLQQIEKFFQTGQVSAAN